MRLKSYFVHTMEEALQSAKVDLGEDAMLVDSKPLQASSDGRARLEVIFAAPASPTPPPKAAQAAAPPAPRELPELHQVRAELEMIRTALDKNPGGRLLDPFAPAWPQLEIVRARLLQSETPIDAVDEVLRRCAESFNELTPAGTWNEEKTLDVVSSVLTAEWSAPPAPPTNNARTIALIGATGVGKTSAIAKLAFRFGIEQAQYISVLSIDNLRIGASDQLAQICSLLGIRFEAVDNSGRLPAVVEAHRHCKFILIDTPGYGPNDTEIADDAAQDLRRIESVDVHLAIPASLRYRDMQRLHRRFSNFQPAKVLFTRLDETESFGPAWAFGRESRLPAEWMSTGPRIPEDLADADPSRVVAAMLSREHVAIPPSKHTQTLASAASAGASRI